MSVPQMATASTFTRTSAGPGLGTGLTTGRRSPGPKRAHARMVWGIVAVLACPIASTSLPA